MLKQSPKAEKFFKKNEEKKGSATPSGPGLFKRIEARLHSKWPPFCKAQMTDIADLLAQMLEMDPKKRISLDDAIKHKAFRKWSYLQVKRAPLCSTRLYHLFSQDRKPKHILTVDLGRTDRCHVMIPRAWRDRYIQKTDSTSQPVKLLDGAVVEV